MIPIPRRSKIWILPLWLLISACTNDDTDCIPNFGGCTRIKPTQAFLNLHVSNSSALVSIYSGSEFETGTLLYSNVPPLGSTDLSVLLPLGYYSATARYVIGKDTVIRVDASVLSYSSEETCTGTCYSSSNGEADLTLDSSFAHH